MVLVRTAGGREGVWLQQERTRPEVGPGLLWVPPCCVDEKRRQAFYNGRDFSTVSLVWLLLTRTQMGWGGRRDGIHRLLFLHF